MHTVQLARRVAKQLPLAYFGLPSLSEATIVTTRQHMVMAVVTTARIPKMNPAAAHAMAAMALT